MKKTAVIYKSKYGSTKTYANWISEALGCDIFEISKITPEILSQYETLVYGGGIYASGISGVKTILKAFGKTKDKNLVVFAVGTSKPSDELIKELSVRNFAVEIRDKIKLFAFGGKLDIDELTGFDKFIMKMFIKMSKKAIEEAKEKDPSMPDLADGKMDNINKDSIAPLVEFVKGL